VPVLIDEDDAGHLEGEKRGALPAAFLAATTRPWPQLWPLGRVPRPRPSLALCRQKAIGSPPALIARRRAGEAVEALLGLGNEAVPPLPDRETDAFPYDPPCNVDLGASSNWDAMMRARQESKSCAGAAIGARADGGNIVHLAAWRR
jgi:hypothetical protein